METRELTKRNAADLHWLATLLTGRPEIATELTFQAIAPALHDAAIRLESDPNLVREGLAAGLWELTTNLARMPWKSGVTGPNTNHEEHYVRPTPIPS